MTRSQRIERARAAHYQEPAPSSAEPDDGPDWRQLKIEPRYQMIGQSAAMRRLFNEIEALRHRDVLGDLDYERVIVDHLMSRSVDEFHARVLAVSIMGIARSALTTWAHDPSCDPGNAAEAALEQLR